jgi:hypothetical protein
VALWTYNVLSVVKSGIAAAQCLKGAKGVPEIERDDILGYYLTGEIATTYHGLLIAIPPEQWTRHFGSLTTAELARTLKTIAKNIRLDRFRKNVRGPKIPRPTRKFDRKHPHVSTARIIAQRKAQTITKC